MMVRARLFAWLLAGLMILALLASLMGDGTGPDRGGRLASAVWLFAVLGLGALLYWVALRSQRSSGGRVP